MELTTTELITQTKNLLSAVRGSLIRVAQNLYRIKEEKAYGEHFGKFCEDELGVSESFASKLLTVNRVYLVDGGLSPEQVEGIDPEKLYLATKLEGTAEEKLAKAETLTRKEIKLERNEEEPHEHEWIELCKHCSIRK